MVAFDLIGYPLKWARIINAQSLSDTNMFLVAFLNMINNLKCTEDSLILGGGGKTMPILSEQGVGRVFAFLFLLNAFGLYSWKAHSYRTLKAK